MINSELTIYEYFSFFSFSEENNKFIYDKENALILLNQLSNNCDLLLLFNRYFNFKVKLPLNYKNYLNLYQQIHNKEFIKKKYPLGILFLFIF